MEQDIIISEHKKNKEDSLRFKERRYAQWNENYALYRDKVATNRLTQRQPVNIPIIRETVQTWISKIDEAPKLHFESRDRDKAGQDAQLFFNEVYNYYYDKLKLDLVDNLDKKIVGLQGRSFKKIGMSNGEIFVDILDPYDIEIDPRCNPLDLESASWIIQTHIYRSLREILANKNYDSAGKNQLKQFLDTKEGVIRANSDMESYEFKKERLENLGASNFDDYRASDVMVELNEAYKLIWDSETNQFVRHIITIAIDSIVLSNKTVKEALGISGLPIITWASDPDLNDIWSDGIADSVRTFNKVTNMYISLDLENRTYSNFGMYFFDTKNGTFQPRAFTPKPFGMFGVPGNPSEIIKQVGITPLADTIPTINYLKDLIQSSVAQTPLERGIQQKGNSTLGEVQLSFQQSSGRNSVVSKNYRTAWKEFGMLFYELLSNNSSGVLTLFKKGGDGTIFSKTVTSADWKTPKGYNVRVEVQAEREAASDFDLKKIQYVKNTFASNQQAQFIADRKILELVDWTDEEINTVMQAEDPSQQKDQAPVNKVSQSINFKDLPPDGQTQMAAEAGITLGGAMPNAAQGGTQAPSAVNNPQDSVAATNKSSLTGQ